MNAHKHKADPKRHQITGWSYCVAAGPCNGAAHGSITYIDRCACGAKRLTESNGLHKKRGPWTGGTDEHENL